MIPLLQGRLIDLVHLFWQLMPGWEPVKARLDGMAELLLNE